MAGYGFQVNGDVGNRQIFNVSNMMPIQTESSVPLINQYTTMKKYFNFLDCCTVDNFYGTACNGNCWPEDFVTVYSRFWCALVTIDNPKSYQPCVAIRPHNNDNWTFAYNHAMDTDSDGLFDTLLIMCAPVSSDEDSHRNDVVGYVDLMIFNYPDGLTPSGETYGIRVYDENTNLVFDSGYRYLNILNSATFDLSDTTVEHTYTPVSSDSYYMLEFFEHNQSVISAPSWLCSGGATIDYYVRTRLFLNGIRKKVDDTVILDGGPYADLFGCTALTATDFSAESDLTLLEINLT